MLVRARSLVLVVSSIGSFAFAALGAIGCAGATPSAASPDSSLSSREPLVSTTREPPRPTDSADTAGARQNLLYPYNLPQYRDDLAAEEEARVTPPPNASTR
jgi:hypothetical protein